MSTTYIEFDRTFFKTHKSRSARFTPNKSKGFTLIELLVVISIIALLSTIVLAVVQDGRVKARNATKNNLVMEYVKALALYRENNNGVYPSAGAGEETTARCIGFSETENCKVTLSKSGDNQINSAFNQYIPGPPASKTLITNGVNTFSGVTYSCEDTSCTSYILEWVIEKTNSNCLGNANVTAVFSGNTKCTYYSSSN